MLLPRIIGWWTKEHLERRLTPPPFVLIYVHGRVRRQRNTSRALAQVHTLNHLNWNVSMHLALDPFTFTTSYVYMPYLSLVRRQQSHCWAPFTDETSNRLGLCDITYSTAYYQHTAHWFTNLEQTPLNRIVNIYRHHTNDLQ